MEIQKQLKSHGAWVGKWTFILAATGSAVGLGNIWGFPYKAGTNGGGAFVLIYLGCIVSYWAANNDKRNNHWQKIGQ